ncbi:RNA polymerase factor sigma-54 [Sporosarcina sp. G11-34]|uniref:RNA polymerase factor sigma-54 n=1 Tax=Sporosarcina sp. G11-34 TaxID=2849605 RepID=UPI0022A9BE57|nr:RNA polymerase factor sigma-54 [Sporosarcina sp. G11-34]
MVLQQRQELTLRMTVELRQAIELLQYSTYELYDYIKEQELDNPLIELEEQTNDDTYKERLNRNSSSTNSSTSPLDYIKSNDIGMRNKLFEQARFLYEDIQDRKLVGFILFNIDDNGYLRFNDDPDPSSTFSETEITRGIHLLQQLGPIGIGARSLKECLLLQITYEYPEQKLAESLVDNYLSLLANRKWNEIASLMNLSLAEVKEISDFIKTLNPKPCSYMSDFTAEYLNPDIIVENKGEGISYYINDGYLPTIHFNNEYSPLLKTNDDTAKYINNKLSNYKWLLSSIEQRRQTISRIVKVIINKQEQFFRDGFIALKPLTLKEIATEIDMHESTVSRATTNKVIQTPIGSFDLRMLFTSKLETTDGNSISQTKVKALLKNIIANENKIKPLSDQKIADYFEAKKEITISRRTISKYREELNIPSSAMRKEI